MSSTLQVASAAGWLWIGMVLAISFLEAPLKFQRPGLDLRMGLAIGRLVFRVLNIDGERSIDDLVVVDREPDVPGRAERDLAVTRPLGYRRCRAVGHGRASDDG